MAKARIEGELTMRDAQFNQTLDRAEKRAATFGQRFQRAIGVEGFKGERRVSRSGALLAGSLLQAGSAADVAQTAIVAFERSLNIGFGGAVALAGGIALIEKFREQTNESRKAYEELQKVGNKPFAIQSQLSPEDIGKQVEELQPAVDKAFEQATSHSNKMLSGFLNIIGKVNPQFAGQGAAFDESLLKPVEEQQEHLSKLSKARGKSELEIAEAQDRTVRGSERLGTLDRIRSQFSEKRAALQLNPDEGTPDRLKALDIQEGLATDQANDKADAAEREFQATMKAARARTEGMTADQQALQSEKDKLANIEAQLTQSRGLTAEKQRQLGVDQQNTTNEIAALQYKEKNKTPEQRASERHEAQRFQQFVRGMTPSNPNAYITSPDAYATSPDAYNKADEVGYDPNGRGGSGWFDKFFHPSAGASDQAKETADSGKGKADEMADKIAKAVAAAVRTEMQIWK